MPNEITARTDQLSGASDEGDYQAFCEALSASERGRAFLTEYTRRNRNADTKQLLAAIDRLQSLVTTHATPQTSEPIKQQLRELLGEIVAARCELETRILAVKASKLAELIALVERRIADVLNSLRDDNAPQIQPLPPPMSEAPDAPGEEGEQTHLIVVPLPEQPELPIPSPAAAQPPSIALVRSEEMIVEVAFVEPQREPDPHPAIDLEPATTRASEPKISEPPEAKRALAPTSPLASIMALSEEERLALFT